MIDFATIRTDIITGLRDYLRKTHAGFLVVELNPGAPRPALPFMSYSFTSPYIPESGQPSEHIEIVPYDSARWGHDPPKDFKSDVQHTLRSNDGMVCSFTVCDDDQDRSIAIVLTAIGWFELGGNLGGYDYLKTKGVIPAEIMPLQNRDVFVVDAWERRQGFDVRFRVLRSTTWFSDTIETADIKRKE